MEKGGAAVSAGPIRPAGCEWVPEHKLQGRGKKGADHRSSSILSLSGFPIETAGELALSGRIGLKTHP